MSSGGTYVRDRQCSIARNGLVLPAELRRKILPHLFGGLGRREIFPVEAIEAPDDSLRKVFESLQIVGIVDGVFAVFGIIAVHWWRTHGQHSQKDRVRGSQYEKKTSGRSYSAHMRPTSLYRITVPSSSDLWTGFPSIPVLSSSEPRCSARLKKPDRPFAIVHQSSPAESSGTVVEEGTLGGRRDNHGGLRRRKT